MRVVIFAGGLGTRLREETEFRPKPMVEIGDRPILWHIMNHYSRFGFDKFVICLGYKGDVIRDYFLNYRVRRSDVTVTLGSGNVEIHTDEPHQECAWTVTLAETGQKSMTGGRLKRVGPYLDSDIFLATYGDAVANVDIPALLACHAAKGKLATVTAVRPSSRFGELSLDDGLVNTFEEKPQVQASWINGGFFVFNRRVLDLIEGDDDTLESHVLMKLASMRQLAVFEHRGFWQCMDTVREVELLNKLWGNGNPPWIADPPPPAATTPVILPFEKKAASA